jgi:hypothetical protein
LISPLKTGSFSLPGNILLMIKLKDLFKYRIEKHHASGYLAQISMCMIILSLNNE